MAHGARVADYAKKHGFGWRPHIKTHKSKTIAAIQLEAGARGLTVATLREAEVCFGIEILLNLRFSEGLWPFRFSC